MDIRCPGAGYFDSGSSGYEFESRPVFPGKQVAQLVERLRLLRRFDLGCPSPLWNTHRSPGAQAVVTSNGRNALFRGVWGSNPTAHRSRFDLGRDQRSRSVPRQWLLQPLIRRSRVQILSPPLKRWGSSVGRAAESNTTAVLDLDRDPRPLLAIVEEGPFACLPPSRQRELRMFEEEGSLSIYFL